MEAKEYKEDFEKKLDCHNLSAVFASMKISRKSIFYIYNIFLLIFLINSMSFLIFATDCKSPQIRLPMNLTLLLANILLKWRTNSYIPAVSYLTMLDIYNMISIIFICIQTSWNAIIAGVDISVSGSLDRSFLIGISSAFGLFNILFVTKVVFQFWKLKKLRDLETDFLKV